MVGRQLLAGVVVSCALALSLLAGCGGGGAGGAGGAARVVARVGHESIDSSTVARWMSALAPGHVVPDPPSYSACAARRQSAQPEAIGSVLVQECALEYEELRHRAVSSLISARWLTGEAREEGLRIDVGKADLRRSPIRGGKSTAADARLAAEARLAAAAIANALRGREPKPTNAEVVRYYRRDVAGRVHPEVRRIYLAEAISSRAAAIRRRAEVLSGRLKMASAGIHETVERGRIPVQVHGEAALLRTIFATRPGVVSPVLPYNRQWAFVEVVHVTPAWVQPRSQVLSLAQARGAIEARLSSERARRALLSFVAAWRTKWMARTSCLPDWAVQKCRQFQGFRGREDPLALS